MVQIREDFQTLINHFLTMVEGGGLSDMLLNYKEYGNEALYEACEKHTHKIGKIDDMRRLAIDKQITVISNVNMNELCYQGGYYHCINNYFKLGKNNNNTINKKDIKNFKMFKENINMITFYELLDKITSNPDYGNFFVKMYEENHPYFYILPYTDEVTKYFLISMCKIQRDNLDNIDNMTIELDKLETMHRQFKNHYDDLDQNFHSMRTIYNLPRLDKKAIGQFREYRSY